MVPLIVRDLWAGLRWIHRELAIAPASFPSAEVGSYENIVPLCEGAVTVARCTRVLLVLALS